MTRESVRSILCELKPLELQPSGSALYCCDLGSQDAAARARAGGQGGELSCEASAAKPHAGIDVIEYVDSRPRLGGCRGRESTVITPGGYKFAAFGAGPGHPGVFYNY